LITQSGEPKGRTRGTGAIVHPAIRSECNLIVAVDALLEVHFVYILKRRGYVEDKGIVSGLGK
jgi:hypothetical protein